MKRLLFLLLLAPAIVYSQTVWKDTTITPVISTTTLDSLNVTSGSTTVRNGQLRTSTEVDSCVVVSGSTSLGIYTGAVGTYSAISAGWWVVSKTGTAIPAGTRIVTKTSATALVMSAAATATDSTDTLLFYAPATRFASVVAGQSVIGAGIPYGTTVASKTDTATIVLSVAATATATAGTLNLGYFTSTAYASGDQLGFPFRVMAAFPSFSRATLLQSVTVIDQADQGSNIDLVLFTTTFQPSLDNAAFSPADSDAVNIIAVIPLTTWYNYGANQICTEPNVNMVIRKTASAPAIYGILVSKGTPTFVTVSDLKLKLYFLQE